MRLLIVLCALVCAIEAAKYKYFVQSGVTSLAGGIWVLHDRNVDLFASLEKPSSGLYNFLTTNAAGQYLGEVRQMKGVYDAQSISYDAVSHSATFYVQSDRDTDRLSFITRTTSTSSFYAVLGARLPLEVITSFSGEMKQWAVSVGQLVQGDTAPNTWGQISGRQICPTNDATVYVKIVNPAKASALGTPIFWTQSGGSNDVFWPGSTPTTGFTSLIAAASSTTNFLLDANVNEDICYITLGNNAALTTEGTYGVWAIPVAHGQKLFFAVRGNVGTANLVFSTVSNGIPLFKDNALQYAVSVNNELAAYTVVAGKVQLYSVDASASVNAYVYDHFPTGTEFPEEQEDITTGHELDECGSYVKNEETGEYEPQEWKHHPYDCTDQEIGGKTNVCMFCKGRANDKVRSVCLSRLGSGCNAAFNSPPRATFCNLEFECPASTISFPIFAILSLLGLLFFAL